MSAAGRKVRPESKTAKKFCRIACHWWRKRIVEVPDTIWSAVIGGYQVCEKWLKDRKGRQLAYDDIQHWQRIVLAVKETMRLRKEIDEKIPDWPLP
jgi:hypothetical protein